MTTNWRERFEERFEDTIFAQLKAYPEIKSFIQQTLKEELKAVAGVVEKIKIKVDSVCAHYQDNCSCYTKRDVDARNSGIAAVQAIINHKIKNV